MRDASTCQRGRSSGHPSTSKRGRAFLATRACLYDTTRASRSTRAVALCRSTLALRGPSDTARAASWEGPSRCCGALWPGLPGHARLSVRRRHAWLVSGPRTRFRRCFVTAAVRRAPVARHVPGCHAPPPTLLLSRSVSDGPRAAAALCCGSPLPERFHMALSPRRSPVRAGHRPSRQGPFRTGSSAIASANGHVGNTLQRLEGSA
jgi:hypothetical protein